MKTAALLPALALTMALAGCDTTPPKVGDISEGYLCCNMRTDGKWISDCNYQESGKTIVPFGTPLKFRGYGRYRANFMIGNTRQSIGNDYSRDLSMEEFAKRYMVKDDPRLKVASAPPKIRQAIESARVTKGMTREQVLIAIGYPISSENPHLDASVWKYWLWSFSPYTVSFDSNGLVSEVTSDPGTLQEIYME